MKKLVFVLVLCICMLFGIVAQADGDHSCPHEYTVNPTGYETFSTGHTPYWECIYCGHTDFGTIQSHNGGMPVVTTYGTSNLCYTEAQNCNTCGYLMSYQVVTTHWMGWIYDNFDDAQKHDKYYECMRAVQCGYRTIGPILENHDWDANFICEDCGYVLN